MSLRIVPVKFRDAAAFIDAWHRHNKAPPGIVFCLGAADNDGVLRAVATVGRPLARNFDDGMTLEVSRTASDGTRNANSILYGAAWRVAKGLGYRRLVTYTQGDESGCSLRAAGYVLIAERPPRKGWDVPSRPCDNDSYLSTTRYLWEAS